MTLDGLTILHAAGRRLAKLLRPGTGPVGYDDTRLVNLDTAEAPDLDALHALLADLAPRRDRCILRGGIADPARVRRVRRLLHHDPDTGEAPTLRGVPRAWAALDLDGIAAPDELDWRDLAACGRVARKRLPEPFRDVACIVAATASHGIKAGLRLRLWCRLSRPLDGAEAVRWLRPHKRCGLDVATLRPAQPIYTAAPVFAGGLRDPLPQRLVRLDGAPAVAVPCREALAPPPPPPPPRRAHDPADAVPRFAALLRAVARAAEGERHPMLFWAACRTGELVADGLLGRDAATDALVRAAGDAGGRDLDLARRTAADGIARSAGGGR